MAFWIIVALVSCTLHSKIRASMVGVLRAFFVRPILIGVFFLIAYYGCVVLLLAQIGIWAPSQSKLTFLWLGTAGFLGLYSLVEVSENPEHLSKSAQEIFQITIVLEFFINLYRMPIFAELIFVPLSVFLGTLIAVARLDKAHRSVDRLLTGFAFCIGFALLAYAAWRTVKNPAVIIHLETLRSFILPVIYSLFLLPFVWAGAIYIAYQSIFIRLNFVARDETLHPYIKRQLVFGLRGNIRHLRAWFQSARYGTLASKEEIVDSARTLRESICTL